MSERYTPSQYEYDFTNFILKTSEGDARRGTLNSFGDEPIRAAAPGFL